MSARSAQRTRWRRWRMGRDIAGRKDRDGRMGGCEAQIVGGATALWGSASSSSFGQTITRTKLTALTDEAILFIQLISL